MNRIMKSSLIVLSLLIYMLISLQGTFSATKTEVTGIADTSQSQLIDPGEVWVDGGGNTHIENLLTETPTSITLGDFLSREEINGVVNAEGNGHFHGSVTLFIPPDGYSTGDEIPTDAIRFSGNSNWTEEDSVLDGQFEFQGSGDFAGTMLLGTFEGTIILQIEGFLHGE